MIEVSNLTKRYQTKKVLTNINLSLKQNQTLGLVGRNGAGKTTLIKIILGFLRPTEGEVKLFGRKAAANHGSVGYLPEQASYHLVFSGQEYLTLLGKMSGLSAVENRVSEVLDLVGMTRDASRRMSRYSKGMLQRLGVAQAILLDPALLILDEPLTGLDPAGQKDLRDIIIEMQRQHKSILLCSHLLNEVERVCSHFSIIHNSSIIAQGSLQKELFSSNDYKIKASGISEEMFAKLREIFNLSKLSADDYLFKEETGGQKESLLRSLLDGGATIAELGPVQKSLEDYFLRATGGQYEDH
ncbi:ABC transporter ATP-binding protein [Desulfosporosinus sp. PR]|uniref:ABC transporter ATP-binding protein n=1 Tax=Candidatus Desulfosporosinus nitrosoreducens TaxID=3401928 RepID=UPI0027FC175E|nr:ABC transporter ATP-binding protein [Desulfosporosinus sp. PR]MDQ7095352.1 ABC transporter ATP-binding protein [Desulfosporosinus sp. PR]